MVSRRPEADFFKEFRQLVFTPDLTVRCQRNMMIKRFNNSDAAGLPFRKPFRMTNIVRVDKFAPAGTYNSASHGIE
jgi:hypothetical protein